MTLSHQACAVHRHAAAEALEPLTQIIEKASNFEPEGTTASKVTSGFGNTQPAGARWHMCTRRQRCTHLTLQVGPGLPLPSVTQPEPQIISPCQNASSALASRPLGFVCYSQALSGPGAAIHTTTPWTVRSQALCPSRAQYLLGALVNYLSSP